MNKRFLLFSWRMIAGYVGEMSVLFQPLYNNPISGNHHRLHDTHNNYTPPDHGRICRLPDAWLAGSVRDDPYAVRAAAGAC